MKIPLVSSDSGEDLMLNLGLITGKTEDYMATLYVEYLKSDVAELEVDVDRVMENLDKVSK